MAVQVGDQLDRGPDEIAILYFLERLKAEARLAGGALYVLNGERRNTSRGPVEATRPLGHLCERGWLRHAVRWCPPCPHWHEALTYCMCVVLRKQETTRR